MDDLPVRVVCATKHDRAGFPNTLLHRSLDAFKRINPVGAYIAFENADGLSEVYNRAIDHAKDKPALLVFVHDDVLITDFWWSHRLRDWSERFDVMGIAGNRRRCPGQASWCILDAATKKLDAAGEWLSGALGQGTHVPPQRFEAFGHSGVACKVLDGLLLAVDSRKLHENGIRFDERFRFHFYDVDFCRTADIAGLTLGTIPLSVVHASYGRLDAEWEAAYRTYIEKWGD